MAEDKINKLYTAHLMPKGRIQMARRMVFADGFKMSVQASQYHYCAPRIDGCDHYSGFEVGFPSGREDLLMPYIDGDEGIDPTEAVYAYVPAEVLDQIVERHGGIAGSKEEANG